MYNSIWIQFIYLQKADCQWDKQSIELAAHDHKHNIKPEYKNKKADEMTKNKTKHTTEIQQIIHNYTIGKTTCIAYTHTSLTTEYCSELHKHNIYEVHYLLYWLDI